MTTPNQDNPGGSDELPSVIELMVEIRKYWTTANGEPELRGFAEYVRGMIAKARYKPQPTADAGELRDYLRGHSLSVTASWASELGKAYLADESIDELFSLFQSHFQHQADQLRRECEAEVQQSSNYSRVASLKDLLTWLKLHDIEDITMVQEYVEHVESSIKQSPNQRHVEYYDLRAQLTNQPTPHTIDDLYQSWLTNQPTPQENTHE